MLGDELRCPNGVSKVDRSNSSYSCGISTRSTEVGLFDKGQFDQRISDRGVMECIYKASLDKKDQVSSSQ